MTLDDRYAPEPGEPSPIPAGASQSYVYDPAARAEVILQAEKAAEHSTAPQWIHEHPYDQPCTGACGPLEQVRRGRIPSPGIPF